LIAYIGFVEIIKSTKFMEKKPFSPIGQENKKKDEYFNAPKDPDKGAITTSFLDDLAEFVTGEPIEEPRIDWTDDEFEINRKHQEEIETAFSRNYFPEERRHHQIKHKEISEYISNLMRGKVVLDLGCGVQAAGYRIADYAKAEKYIGVEKNFGRTAFNRTSQVATADSIPFDIIQQDMIGYVQDRSNKADVVLLVGIDLIIIPKYKWDSLLQGLHEILSEDGRLLVGGGFEKPFDLIEKYFEGDPALEDIEQKFMTITQRGLSTIPTIWKKKRKEKTAGK